MLRLRRVDRVDSSSSPITGLPWLFSWFQGLSLLGECAPRTSRQTKAGLGGFEKSGLLDSQHCWVVERSRAFHWHIRHVVVDLIAVVDPDMWRYSSINFIGKRATASRYGTKARGWRHLKSSSRTHRVHIPGAGNRFTETE